MENPNSSEERNCNGNEEILGYSNGGYAFGYDRNGMLECGFGIR